MLVPGLTGNNSVAYITSLVTGAHKMNYDVVVVNHRTVGAPITVTDFLKFKFYRVPKDTIKLLIGI